MENLFNHPLTLLVAGAFLTGIVIPLITRNWQLRQKALEILIALVSDIGQAVVEFLMSVQFVHMKRSRGNLSQDEQSLFDQSYKDWEVKSAVIGTELQAYYHRNAQIPKTWTTLSTSLTNFYALEGTCESHLDVNMSALAQQISGTLPCQIAMTEASREERWGRLREAILQCKSEIIRAVLLNKPSLS
jgi:hypothetical protein